MDTKYTIPVTVHRVSDEIYNTPVQFCDLPYEYKRELLKLWMQGCTIEVYSHRWDGWREVKYPMWYPANCYRIKWTENEMLISKLEDELLALEGAHTRKQEELEQLLR